MSSENHTPPFRLNPVILEFPTDGITLGQMRRNEPQLLDDHSAAPGHVAANEVFSAHRFELMLAEKAFADARDLPDPSPDVAQAEIVSVLHGVYSKFGITTGMHATRQAVRNIESAAAQQAKARQGR